MMEVPTPSIWKTSTWLTLPSRARIWTPSPVWTAWGWSLPGSGSRWAGRCWRVGSSSPIRGAAAAAAEGRVRDSVVRRLAHVPFGWRPTVLEVTVRRYRCRECGWCGVRTPPPRPSRGPSCPGCVAVGVGGPGLVSLDGRAGRPSAGGRVGHRERCGPGRGRRVLIDDPDRFTGVAVIGVNEHCWRHTSKGDKYVTVIIDLTPVRDRTGPARLLDMVEGRSRRCSPPGSVIRIRPGARCHRGCRDGRVHRLQNRCRARTSDRGPGPDPFHVIRLAGDAPSMRHAAGFNRPPPATAAARRPLYAARRTLNTGSDLLTDRQCARLRRCSPSRSMSKWRRHGASTSG